MRHHGIGGGPAPEGACVAIVGAVDDDGKWCRIIAVLGPFDSEKAAMDAGLAEFRKHQPGDQGDEDEMSIEYDVHDLIAPQASGGGRG